MLNKEEFKKLFLKQTEELGLIEYCSDDLISKLCEIQNDILEKNKYMNITSITQDDRFIALHWMDGLAVLKYIKDGDRIIDIGTGGGMIPIIIALAKPSSYVFALDSSNKRINYLQELINKFNIKNLKAISARAEDYVRNDKKQRESYDVVLARAVANLRVLSELCIPYVKLNGVFVAMKGPSVKTELEESSLTIKKLGCSVKEDDIFEIKYENETFEHHNLVIQKDQKTDNQYPRNYNQILKFPL